MDVLLQKQEIGGVYLGKDGYLLEQHLPEDYPRETVEKRLALLERLVEDWNADVMLVPTADNILTDKLPGNAPYFQQEEFLEEVEKRGQRALCRCFFDAEGAWGRGNLLSYGPSLDQSGSILRVSGLGGFFGEGCLSL